MFFTGERDGGEKPVNRIRYGSWRVWILTYMYWHVGYWPIWILTRR